jgi:hypothetical protein
MPGPTLILVVGDGALARDVEATLVAAGAHVRRLRAPVDRELRSAFVGTVWQSGCSNWYVDENGNDPNNWPWVWSAYRRRTRDLAPGAYELAGSR